MSIDFNLGSYLIRDILQNTSTNEDLTYASDNEDKKQAALDYATDIIKGLEKDYNKNHESISRGILNTAEADNISKYEDELTELNLDDKEGLSKEELASYILAADGLARIKDSKYNGWEFMPDADITDEDLKKTVYEESITDGTIDENNIYALENMKTSELKAAAQAIYDENFKEVNTAGFLAFVKTLFIH